MIITYGLGKVEVCLRPLWFPSLLSCSQLSRQLLLAVAKVLVSSAILFAKLLGSFYFVFDGGPHSPNLCTWLVIRWVLEIFRFFELISNFRNFWNFWNFDFLFLDLLLDTNFSFKGFNKNCPASSWKGILVISRILGTFRYFTQTYISRQVKWRGNFRNFRNFGI